MSHFTTIETQVRDTSALKAACQELGLRLTENSVARGYGANQLKGDFVIHLNGPYDIALTRQPDGSFKLTSDFWGGHVEREVGPHYGRLLQLYGVHKAVSAARCKGYTFRRQTLGDGSIKLVIAGVCHA